MESTFAEEAKLLGVPIEQVLRQHLVEARERSAAGRERAEAIHRMFEDIHAIVGHRGGPPIPDEALRRENLYSREDELG